jgi:NADH-quinone oxidoreductase subunit D
VLVAIGAARHLPHDLVASLDPRHPLSHAPMQLRLELDGEVIVAADPQIGLLNRSVEKLFEARDYRQLMMLANRHDWVSPFASEVGVALTLEDAMGITPPECATWTRTLLLELTRVSAALLFIGAALGDQTTLALRESYVDLQERATGNRVHPMFARIGGIAQPVSTQWLGIARELTARTRADLTRISDALHAYAQAHSGIATLTHADAQAFGATGPVGQASGVRIDLRIQQPYLAYGELVDLLPSLTQGAGDLAARYASLLAEINPSLNMIDACADRVEALGDAPVNMQLPKVVKAPEGTYYGRIDSPTGVSGYLLVSTAEKAPWRFKLRTPSFAHAQALTNALVGCPVDQLDDALMSFFLVTGDIDR